MSEDHMTKAQLFDVQSAIYLKFGLWQHALVSAVAATIVRSTENKPKA
jgi:hypothetical protein